LINKNIMASLAANHTDREKKYIQEAEKHFKEAKGLLKTSFTKWKADYLMAGPAFAKAGNSYRLGKELKLAVDCYMNAAMCGEKSGQTYETGKYRDLAAQILAKSKDPKDQSQAAELYCETMNIFMGMEDYMGGATVCKKAVAIYSKIDPEKAVTMNRDMIDQLESVGKGVYALEMYRGTIMLACKAQRWQMAHDMIKKAIVGFIAAGRPPSAIYGWHLSEIIILAKIGDKVALDEAFLASLDTQGYGMSDQAEVAEEINRGMKDNDMERCSAAMELRGMKNGLLPIIVNLAKSLWPKITNEEDSTSKKKAQQKRVVTNNQAPAKIAQKGGGGSSSSSSSSSSDGGETGETKTAKTVTAAPTIPAATSDGLDDMDDLMDGLDDLVSGLPEANEDDDDLL
jgi:hypothetical protein